MRAKVGIMMGSGQTTCGYRFWLKEEKHMIETIVSFRESIKNVEVVLDPDFNKSVSLRIED